MNDLGKKEILTDFPYYLEEHKRLEREYVLIRNWPVVGFIRQMINLRKREKLNKWYEGKMQQWEL